MLFDNILTICYLSAYYVSPELYKNFCLYIFRIGNRPLVNKRLYGLALLDQN